MCAFQTGLPERATLDPAKRVNYSFGQVLGVDEFVQEQTYLVEKGRLHNRALHGYGVISGLAVAPPRPGDANPELVVGPGLAVDQLGRTICVGEPQCARLNTWLTDNRAKVRQQLGLGAGASPDGANLDLYVVLCYRECETDVVEIAGRPCASDDESRAPSRITETFGLSLRTPSERPAAREEGAVQRFGELVSQIAISVEPGEALDAEELSELVRGLATASYPTGGPPLRLRPEDACAVLDAAFRTWVTEVRPLLVGDCAAGPGDEGCLILARISFTVSDAWQVQGAVTVALDDRPVLLHTRLLQEWLMCGRPAYAGAEAHFATACALSPDTVRVWVHHLPLLDIPVGAVAVELDGVPAPVLGISRPTGVNVFDLALGEGSFPAGPIGHKQRITVRFDAALIEEIGSVATPLAEVFGPGYDVVDRRGPIISVYGVAELPALDDLTDVAAGGAVEGDVLIRRGAGWAAGKALKAGDTAGGDLDGTYPNPTVDGLQGTPISATRPAHGQLLGFSGAIARPHWEPVPAGPLQHGGVLTWSEPRSARAAGQWEAQGRPATGNLQSGHLLSWNGSQWEAQGRPATGSLQNGQLLVWNGSQWAATTGTLQSGQLLAWDGGQWVTVGPGTSTDQVLGWNGSQWAPATVSTGGGLTIEQIAERLPTLPFVTIRRESAPEHAENDDQVVFQLWFHLNGGSAFAANLPQLLGDFGVEVYGEREDASDPAHPFLTKFDAGIIGQPARNVYALAVKRQGSDPNRDIDAHSRLRFLFNPGAMQLNVSVEGRAETRSLHDWLMTQPIKWEGHDGGDIITAFYQQPQTLIVAAGRALLSGERVRMRGKRVGGLAVSLEQGGNSVVLFRLTFLGFRPGGSYIVKGTPLADKDADGGYWFFDAGETSDKGILCGLRIASEKPPAGVDLEVTQII